MSNDSRIKQTAEQKVAQELQASMIWTELAPAGRQAYVVFRKRFDLAEKAVTATLRIFADTRYMLWINGQYAERGPCRFDPKRPEYDVLDVSRWLNREENVLAILVHHYAIKNFKHWAQQVARMMDHEPGLTAKLDVVMEDGRTSILLTDTSWRTLAQTRFQPSPGTYTSIWDRIDSRLDDGDWTRIEFDDSNWVPSVPIDGRRWGPLCPRSIPRLRETTIVPQTIVQEIVAGQTNNQPQPLTARLPVKMEDGHQLVIDVGHMVQAYSVVEFEATEGSTLELDYATQFFDTGQRPLSCRFAHLVELLPRTDINSYVACGGPECYISSDTFGFRYLVIRVATGRVTLRRVMVVDRRYPYERLGRFCCNDETLNRLWEIGVNTVEVCSEDAYVDCADRERAEWMADGYMMSYPVSRVALAGPGCGDEHAYADPRLLRNLLRHVALSQLSDGRLRPMRPTEYPVDAKHGVIDDYSCLWVQAVRELCERSDDDAFAREVWPILVKALNYFLNRRTKRGLVHAVEFIYFHNPLAYVECEGASINAFVYGALRDAAWLGRRLGEANTAARFDTAADELCRAYNEHLWNAQTRTYHGAIISNDSLIAKDTPSSYAEQYKGPLADGKQTPATGHAAVMALYYRLISPERHLHVLNFMLEHFPQENPYPYTYRYFLEVLYRQNTAEMDMLALNTIRHKFGPMTRFETGTTSENWNVESFVHEAGAHPAYYLSAYVLGVRTEGSRKERRLLIEPRLGDLKTAEGVVLTEHGPVSVSWHQMADGGLAFDFTIPKGVSANVSIPVPQERFTLTMNNQVLVDTGRVQGKAVLKDRWVVIYVGSGRYFGKTAT